MSHAYSQANLSAANLPSYITNQLTGDQPVYLGPELIGAGKPCSLRILDVEFDNEGYVEIQYSLGWKQCLVTRDFLPYFKSDEGKGETWEYKSIYCRMRYPVDIFNERELRGFRTAATNFMLVRAGKLTLNSNIIPFFEEVEEVCFYLSDSKKGVRMRMLNASLATSVIGGPDFGQPADCNEAQRPAVLPAPWVPSAAAPVTESVSSPADIPVGGGRRAPVAN